MRASSPWTWVSALELIHLRAGSNYTVTRALTVDLLNPTRLETRTKESNMCASIWVINPNAEGSRQWRTSGALQAELVLLHLAAQEHICWDPKDGELCLCRLKAGEILLEDRRDTDVQIVLQT